LWQKNIYTYMKQLTCLLLLLGFFSCQNAGIDNQLTEAAAKIETLKAELVEAKNPELAAKPGFIHSVFLWLNDEISAEATQQFEKDLQSLKQISHIQNCYIGPAAGTPREVVDNSYDYALIIHFKDKAAQAAYQIDPIHTHFVEAHKANFKKVQVYDNLVE
jgi:hypothetical protein